METKELADLLNVVPNTIRRWTEEYHRFLSPTAHPPKGKNRVLTLHDARVLHYIKAARDTGQAPETIMARLESMMADDWRNLPDVPPEWDNPAETMTVVAAADRAYDLAALAVAQRELEMVQQALQEASARAENAELRVKDLEAEIATQRATESVAREEFHQQLHTAQIELSQARGEVAELKARLSAYAITGGDKPIPVALIVLVTAVAAVLVVLLVFVVARLLL